MSFINPIDLTLSLFIIAIAIFGIRNGCIIEIKKTSNLLLSIILSKILITYIPVINIQGQLIKSIIFFSSLALLLFIIGFISYTVKTTILRIILFRITWILRTIAPIMVFLCWSFVWYKMKTVLLYSLAFSLQVLFIIIINWILFFSGIIWIF